MRSLSYPECNFTYGGAFIEGYITDDFAVAGALIGLVGALGLWVYARRCYQQESISFKEATSCVLLTAYQAAKYGLIVDTLWQITHLLK